MSKAFTREEDAPPERSTRTRSASGLSPGALNYLTADGARLLRAELAASPDSHSERAAEIGRILATATVVEPPAEAPDSAVFGAKVELQESTGRVECFRIVGVDEVNLAPGWVSWISPIGRSLLGAEPGQRVILEVAGERRKFTVTRIGY